MDTATDQEPRYLMSSTQRLGFLPTRWFWKDKRNRRLVAWLYGAVAFVTIEIGAHVGAHPLIVGASLLVTIPLAEGLLERYVRRKVMKRRALAETNEREAIGP